MPIPTSQPMHMPPPPPPPPQPPTQPAWNRHWHGQGHRQLQELALPHQAKAHAARGCSQQRAARADCTFRGTQLGRGTITKTRQGMRQQWQSNPTNTVALNPIQGTFIFAKLLHPCHFTQGNTRVHTSAATYRPEPSGNFPSNNHYNGLQQNFSIASIGISIVYCCYYCSKMVSIVLMYCYDHLFHCSYHCDHCASCFVLQLLRVLHILSKTGIHILYLLFKYCTSCNDHIVFIAKYCIFCVYCSYCIHYVLLFFCIA